MHNEYHAEACNCQECNTIVALDLSKYDAIIDKIAQDLHAGKLKPEDLNQDMINQTYADLNEASGNGYGKNWNAFPADGKGATPMRLKQNLYAFSSAKTYTQLEAINRLLVDADGKLRPYNEFEQLAKKTGLLYNKNYLQAEYQTARTSAQMIEKWERLQETKSLFPNLKFRTVGDDRVRDKHRALNGIIKPIDDKFWDKYYPPLDWRCRCDVVATAEDADEKLPKDLPEPQLKEHVGKSQEIFTKKGTYFKLANTKENIKRNMELVKLNAPYEQGYKVKNGKKIEVNIFADKVDLDDNIDAAIRVVDELNKSLWIRPHINLDKFKNPEFWDGKRMGDMTIAKSNNLSRYISNSFDSKFGKDGQLRDESEAFIILNVNKKLEDGDVNKIARQLWAKFKIYSNCKYAILITSEKSVEIANKNLVNFEEFEKRISI